MRFENFGFDDIVDYLNQELPGFDPSLIRDQSTHTVTMRVRSRLTFGSYAQIPEDHLFVSLPGHGYGLQGYIDDFIRNTRQDMIAKLGLQKEIDAEVKRGVERERAALEKRAYEKAYTDAMSAVVKAEEDRAARLWNAFMGRPVEPGEPIDRDH